MQEGRWVLSKKKDWFLRLDPPNPQIKQQRHVHIARGEHLNSKNMQVSWNQNGTRHDKTTFNQNIKGMKTAKKIARDALGLDPNVILEYANEIQQSSFLNESTTNLVQTKPITPVLLIAMGGSLIH